MNPIRRSLLVFTACASLLSPVQAQPASFLRGQYVIPNVGAVKNQLRDYVKSGQYKEELNYVASKAREYLDRRLGRPVLGKPAICLDIDETCLSNYGHIEEMDFGYLAPAWNKWVEQAAAPPIEGVLELYRYAKARNVHVLLITGRPKKQQTVTENNLRQAGYESWAELVFKPEDVESAQAFKSAQRQRLAEAGYTILVNVGDQDSDLEGGYSESSFKLPNPMYWVP
jgi:acid phosphatase